MDYNRLLQEFVEKLTADQKSRLVDKNYHSQVNDCYAYFESGRKFDKIIIKSAGGPSVRFFVDKKNGDIYGARSRLAPNEKWWFGTLETVDNWYWGDFHPTPKNPDDYMYIGRYGPYSRWAPK